MRRAVALCVLLLVACREAQQQKAREAALKHTLLEMRKAIEDFRQDKKRGPHSLEELKAAHYLSNIPKDSITGNADWRVSTTAAVQNSDFTTAAPAGEPEVFDVHSRAAGRDSTGKLYSGY